jgi:hypothetical protein
MPAMSRATNGQSVRRHRPHTTVTLAADVSRELRARSDGKRGARSALVDQALRSMFGLPDPNQGGAPEAA